MNTRDLVNEYFAAEERGDVEAVVALCADNVLVRNAAQPSQKGKQGVREYVTSFRDRTSQREFQVLAVAEGDGVVFAWWSAQLSFKAGVSFGPVTTRRPFELKLQGICRFRIDAEGWISELDVFHETTTGSRLAQEAAA